MPEQVQKIDAYKEEHIHELEHRCIFAPYLYTRQFKARVIGLKEVVGPALVPNRGADATFGDIEIKRAAFVSADKLEVSVLDSHAGTPE